MLIEVCDLPCPSLRKYLREKGIRRVEKIADRVRGEVSLQVFKAPGIRGRFYISSSYVFESGDDPDFESLMMKYHVD